MSDTLSLCSMEKADVSRFEKKKKKRKDVSKQSRMRSLDGHTSINTSHRPFSKGRASHNDAFIHIVN